MKILKYIFPICSLFICFSCSQKLENVESGVIGFAAATYSLQTKGDVIDFPTTSDIGAFAWRSASGAAGQWAADPSLTTFMTNIQAQYDGTSGVWVQVSDNKYKWPGAGYLHFFCYSPYKSASPFSWSAADGLAVASYTVPDGAGEDLCYSDITVNQTRGEEDATPADVLMRHALCKVSFDVQAADVPDGLAVVKAEVSDVKVVISNIKKTGSFAAANATTEGGEKNGKWSGAAWSSQSGSASYTFDSSHNGLVLMPQTLTTGGASDQQFTVSYKAKVTYIDVSTEEEATIEFNREETHPLYCESCTAWGVNQHIVYKLSINLFGDEMLFSPHLTDWDDTSVTIKIGYEDPLI